MKNFNNNENWEKKNEKEKRNSLVRRSWTRRPRASSELEIGERTSTGICIWGKYFHHFMKTKNQKICKIRGRTISDIRWNEQRVSFLTITMRSQLTRHESSSVGGSCDLNVLLFPREWFLSVSFTPCRTIHSRDTRGSQEIVPCLDFLDKTHHSHISDEVKYANLWKNPNHLWYDQYIGRINGI